MASSPNFTFIGNVAVGHGRAHDGGQFVRLATLLRHHDAVVFAYGASKDRTLDIPGESLKRIYSAREFVGWYNGLPEFAGLDPDLSQDQAVVIGQGNVALDVARILLENVDVLRTTDIAGYALEALSRSRVKRVRVVGRRGVAQAAFSTKELRQLLQLEDVGFQPVDQDLLIPKTTKTELSARGLERRMDLLRKHVLRGSSDTDFRPSPKQWALDFCLSPHSFQPDSGDPSSVGHTKFMRNHLSDLHDPSADVKFTGEAVTVDSPLVFRSIGYKAEPLPEFDSLGIAFDRMKGLMGKPKEAGRVMMANTLERQFQPLNSLTRNFPGLYCAGWVKRGPTGVIASTMDDAFETAEVMVKDWKAGKPFLRQHYDEESSGGTSAGWEGIKSEGDSELAKCAVDWEGWLAIDQAEKQRGKEAGKLREKVTGVEEMLALANTRKS